LSASISNYPNDLDQGFKTASYLQVIRKEIEAQIRKIRDYGINPTHLDSHHHMHTRWPIARVVASLAEELGISNVRMAGDCLASVGFHKRFHRFVVNRLIFQRRVKYPVKRFGCMNSYMRIRPDLGDETIELMIHPGVDSDYALLNSPEYATFLRCYELIGYPTDS
jgi:predicted glycoside hydrolase/deacetylase ChbG (UPF0249 family)